MFRKFLSLVLCFAVVMGVAIVPAEASPPPTKYIVTLHSNQGSGQDKTTTKEVADGDSYTIPSYNDVSFTKPTGKVFSGWAYDAAGSNLVTDKTITVTKNIDLYAIWVYGTFKVTFDLNYSNAPAVIPPEIQVTYDDTDYGDKCPADPTREGYQFEGWFDNKNGVGKPIDLTAAVKITADTILYAKWTPLDVEVSLYYCYPADDVPPNYTPPVPNAPDKIIIVHDGDSSYKVKESDGTETNKLYPPTYPTNYDFDGWFTTEKDENGVKGAQVKADDKVNIKITKLYARWKKTTAELNLDYNYPSDVSDKDFTGGGGKPTNPPSQTIKIGKPIMSSISEDLLEPESPQNYTLDGWYTTKTDQGTAGSKVDAKTEMPDKENFTLYARWSFLVTFDAKEGTVDGDKTTTRSYVVGSKYGELPTPKLTGQAFLGWFPNEDLSGQAIKPTQIVTETPKTFYAKWGDATYTLTFDPNGGSYTGRPSITFKPDTKTYESLLPSKDAPKPTRTGYEFAGWFTAADGGTQVTASTKLTEENLKDHTLYAHWTPIKHTVTFNLNYTGAPAGPAAKQVDYKSKLKDALPATNPTRAGHEFQGWLKVASDRASLVQDADLVTEDITLYADWVSVNALTLDPNGGSVTPTRLDIPATDTVYPTLPTPTWEGYEFSGWTTVKNDENTKVSTGGVIGDPRPTTLYALWKANQYTLTFDGNGATTNPTPRKVTFGQKYGSLPSAHRGGYTFAGWFTEAVGGSEVKADTTVSIAKDHTLYAHWGYTIGFSGNGASGSMANVTAPANTAFTLPSCTFTPPLGKVFKCWAIGSPAGTQITGSSYTFTGNTTLYAVWKDRPLTISASAIGGGFITPSGEVSVEAGEDQSFTVTASNGYRLAHLYVDGEDYGPLESHVFRSVTENHTIQAEFVPIDPPGYLSCGKDIYCPLAMYTDLNPREWYHDAVHYCMDNVIMNGTNVNVYSPNMPATRAMICKVLYQAEGCPDPFEGVLVKPYHDVKPLDWHYPCITWATRAKVAEGYGNSRFGPNDPVTREQVVTMLWRYSGKPEPRGNTLNFFDAHLVHEYARKAMLWATENGIINGKGHGILDPRGYAKRTEIAQIMLNYMG